MDLNHIELPPITLASMYHSVLVVPGKEEIGPGKAPEGSTDGDMSVKTLGNNKKHILLVVDYDSASIIPDHPLSFLTGILSACRLSMDDVVLLNFSNKGNWDMKNILSTFKCNTIFLFGIEPSAFGLPLNFPAFQVQQYQQVTYLYAPSLGILEEDKLLKSKLWLSLKKIFSL